MIDIGIPGIYCGSRGEAVKLREAIEAQRGWIVECQECQDTDAE